MVELVRVVRRTHSDPLIGFEDNAHAGTVTVVQGKLWIQRDQRVAVGEVRLGPLADDDFLAEQDDLVVGACLVQDVEDGASSHGV